MGLRQSKRSVDITSSPKKDAAAPEKVAVNEGTIVEKIEEEIKTPVNGETKTTEPAENVRKNFSELFFGGRVTRVDQ